MDNSLKGKNALIGGGSKGIGLAAAKKLSELGASVTLMSRTEEALKEAIKELDASQGQQHEYLVVNFFHPMALEEIIKEHIKTKEYHILINNTGGPPGGPIVDAKPSDFTKAFNMHLVCNHILTTALIPGMKTSGYGRVINVISTSVKQPLDGLGVSNTIRGAVASWSKTMANELGNFGITVNNVLPGATETGRLKEIIDNKAGKMNKAAEDVQKGMESIIPMKRFAQPEEIGAGIAFLASPAAAYINGINLPIDGGRTKSL